MSFMDKFNMLLNEFNVTNIEFATKSHIKEVDDLGAHKIAREVKEQIEANMKYPGTIKITVVRETRAQEEAK